MAKNKKLGKGLSALMGEGFKEINRDEILSIDKDAVELVSVDSIVAGIYQPRRVFDQVELEDLSKSIQVNGIIQPIIVRKADGNGSFYEIIAGERRFRASKLAGLTNIPVIVKDITDLQAIEFSIIENVQRADLSSIEEANSYKQLMSEFNYTQEDVAKRLGRSRSYVANILRLLTLPEDVQDFVNKGQLSTGHARALVGNEQASRIAKKAIKEGLSVRDIEDLLQSQKPKEDQDMLVDQGIVNESDLKRKNLKNQYLRAVEENMSTSIGLKVKASYDTANNKGKVTIFYNDLDQIENLIKKLES